MEVVPGCEGSGSHECTLRQGTALTHTPPLLPAPLWRCVVSVSSARLCTATRAMSWRAGVPPTRCSPLSPHTTRRRGLCVELDELHTASSRGHFVAGSRVSDSRHRYQAVGLAWLIPAMTQASTGRQCKKFQNVKPSSLPRKPCHAMTHTAVTWYMAPQLRHSCLTRTHTHSQGQRLCPVVHRRFPCTPSPTPVGLSVTSHMHTLHGTAREHASVGAATEAGQPHKPPTPPPHHPNTNRRVAARSGTGPMIGRTPVAPLVTAVCCMRSLPAAAYALPCVPTPGNSRKPTCRDGDDPRWHPGLPLPPCLCECVVCSHTAVQRVGVGVVRIGTDLVTVLRCPARAPTRGLPPAAPSTRPPCPRVRERPQDTGYRAEGSACAATAGGAPLRVTRAHW